MSFRPLLTFILLGIGCAESPPPQHIQAWVKSWGEMGMYLPDEQQVDFLRANFSDVSPELAAALAHTNPDIRQRAAYVIGEIGPVARPLGPELTSRLKVEKDRLIRIYVINALATVGFKDQEAIKLLRIRFESLSSENDANRPGEYADVDEKINVAAALYNLTSGEERQTYLDFVTQWLDPPNPDLAASEVDNYWERRWMAVISLEHMHGATSAVPKLEAMLNEDDSRDWVQIHVPRVLKVVRRPGM